MGVQRSELAIANEGSVFFEGDVLLVSNHELLSQSEVNEVQFVGILVLPPENKVLGLDVSVNDHFLMDFFDPTDHLNSEAQDLHFTEFSVEFCENFFQIFSQQFHDDVWSFFTRSFSKQLREPYILALGVVGKFFKDLSFTA